MQLLFTKQEAPEYNRKKKMILLISVTLSFGNLISCFRSSLLKFLFSMYVIHEIRI